MLDITTLGEFENGSICVFQRRRFLARPVSLMLVHQNPYLGLKGGRRRGTESFPSYLRV